MARGTRDSGASATLQILGSTSNPTSGPASSPNSGPPSGPSSAVQKITQIGAGHDHTCALSGGAVQCWGANSNGQLGNGTTSNSAQPVSVNGLGGAVQSIAVGGYHTCALVGGGAYCWGNNSNGQLGNNAGGSGAQSTVPVAVTGLSSGVQSLTAGISFTCALLTTGAVQCWGFNADGELGNGTTTDSAVPVPVTGLSSGVQSVYAGYQHACALLSSGGIRCWGFNTDGELGNGSTTPSSVPVAVGSLSGAPTALTAAGYHSCVLLGGGAIDCWGQNLWGELGNGSSGVGVFSSTPVSVAGLAGAASAVIAGGHHSCAILSSGVVSCWGENGNGQLGNGAVSTSAIVSPVAVSGLSGASQTLTAGSYHTCAATLLGLSCWGQNTNGELGNGSTTDSSTPVEVQGY